jgi:hypothetical protein
MVAGGCLKRVDRRLEPEEWVELSAAERAQRCRAMASEAQRMSKSAEGELRNVYFALSLHWLALANEIESRESTP